MLSVPACPSCGASLWWGPRRELRKDDTEGRAWYQFAGPRQYCPRCGVGLRGKRFAAVVIAVMAMVISNSLALHWKAHELAGPTGVVLYWLGWIALIVAAALRIRYVRLDPHGVAAPTPRER